MYKSKMVRNTLPAILGLVMVGGLGLVPDSAEAAPQTFCIAGNSNGVGWSWGIVINEGLAAQDTNLSLPAGNGPADFVASFIASINANALPTCTAGPVPDRPDCFQVTCDNDFKFYVGDAAGTPNSGCNVTDTPGGCNFNPRIYEVSQVPALSEWGVVVMVLLLLGAGTIVFGRMRRARTA